MSELSVNIIKQLLKKGFLTGSRYFGSFENGSDYDICYPVYKQEKIDEIVKEYKREESNYFSGFKIQVDEHIINLIPLHPHAVIPWIITTACFRSFYVKDMFEPINKYSIFESMVASFKGNMKPLIDIQTYEKMYIHYISTVLTYIPEELK